jgi:hypothetical protein
MTTPATESPDFSRSLGFLEGRVAEHSTILQDLRDGQRQLHARIDWLFLAMLGIGAAQIALLITLVVRG